MGLCKRLRSNHMEFAEALGKVAYSNVHDSWPWTANGTANNGDPAISAQTSKTGTCQQSSYMYYLLNPVIARLYRVLRCSLFP